MNVRFFLFTITIFGVLTASNCKKEPQESGSFPEIFDQVWLHSYEDDSAGLKAYRPKTYDFPPSRGRKGFEIKKDNTFIYHGIAATDGTKLEYGKWKLSGEKSIEATFNQNMKPRFIWELVKYREGIIFIREKTEDDSR